MSPKNENGPAAAGPSTDKTSASALSSKVSAIVFHGKMILPYIGDIPTIHRRKVRKALLLQQGQELHAREAQR
jgi:hypothetical protein